MGWHQGTLVSFDLETSGVDPETARIVTAAIVTCNPATGSVLTDEWLADPEIDIPAEATAVHGITTEHARANGQPGGAVVDEIIGALAVAWRAGLPVIVYNAPYDFTVLDREARRHLGGGVWHGTVVDPFVLDRQYDRYRKGSRKLTAVAGHYGVPLSEQDAHGAGADALAAARLAWSMANRYSDLGAMDLPELHAKQIVWCAEQARSFERYLRGVKLREEGPDAAAAVSIPQDWPMRPVAVEGVLS